MRVKCIKTSSFGTVEKGNIYNVVHVTHLPSYILLEVDTEPGYNGFNPDLFVKLDNEESESIKISEEIEEETYESIPLK